MSFQGVQIFLESRDDVIFLLVNVQVRLCGSKDLNGTFHVKVKEFRGSLSPRASIPKTVSQVSTMISQSRPSPVASPNTAGTTWNRVEKLSSPSALPVCQKKLH